MFMEKQLAYLNFLKKKKKPKKQPIPHPWPPERNGLKNGATCNSPAGQKTSTISPGHFTCCCSSVAKSCCNPVDCSLPGSPVLHHLPEFTQFMLIELVMLSNHLILRHPLLLLPSIFPSIRVFFNELTHCIQWPKYGSFSFSISPSNE